ncbi:MAG: hypothetical protein CL910_09930 [Deltaproteobacteria bacterium]|nr:hypothetical protein [Deltaproteobacteria bacterium]
MNWNCGTSRAPLLLLLLLLGACSGTRAPTDQGGGAVLTEEHPDAMRTPGWLEFGDLSLRTAAAGKDPRGAHVHGWLLGGVFEPLGDIIGGEGRPPRGRILNPGFLELRTRAFVKKADDANPTPPYVEGWQDTETGGFYPSGSVQRAPRLATAPDGARSGS